MSGEVTGVWVVGPYVDGSGEAHVFRTEVAALRYAVRSSHSGSEIRFQTFEDDTEEAA